MAIGGLQRGPVGILADVRRDGEVVGAVAVEGSAAFFGPLSRLSRSFAAASTGAPSRASAARREGGVGEFIFIGDSLTGPR